MGLFRRKRVADEEEEEETPSRSQSGYADHTKGLLLTALAACGLVYGDIGTSPLYCLNAIFLPTEPVPSPEDVVGAVSAIVWSLILVGLVKTALIALRFGSEAGEGGPFALYTQLYPQNQTLVPHAWMKPVITIVALFAASLTMADGLLAPAVSVVSSVAGLSLIAELNTNHIKGIAIAILACLYISQRLGTGRLNFMFAPIVILWLTFLTVIGAYNIRYHPAIFRAFDPSRAILFFVRRKSIIPLSGVLLCITGVEALFANLGQFNPASIRLSFVFPVFPALILCYLGQGARMIDSGIEVLPNIFFTTIPGGVSGPFWWLTWLLSICATVVASQTIISATFKLIQQVMALKKFPPLRIIHTSEIQKEEIYIPIVNFFLMAGSLSVAGGFGAETLQRGYGTDLALTNAYGFAVSGVLFCTTVLLSLVMYYVKGFSLYIPIVFFIISGFIDASFFASSLQKVPHGAWFTLTLGGVLAVILMFWTWAKGLEDQFDASHRVFLNEIFKHYLPEDGTKLETLEEPGANQNPAPVGILAPGLTPTEEKVDDKLERLPTQLHDGKRVHIIVQESPHALSLADGEGRPLQLPRIESLAFFHHLGSGVGSPHSFSALIRRLLVLPKIVIFLSIRVQHVPHVHELDKILINKIRGLDGFFMMTLRLGYRDSIDVGSTLCERARLSKSSFEIFLNP